jgi:2-oxoglutarate dehydrogenase E2 component (dihydrolipoamide succinyltransferase)
MNIELKIPDVGESIREVQIGRWLKKEGDAINQDEDVVQLETDKASMELPAPEAGVLAKILKQEGETVAVGDVIGYLETDGAASRAKGQQTRKEPAQTEARQQEPTSDERPTKKDVSKKEVSKKPASREADEKKPDQQKPAAKDEHRPGADVAVTPAARRALRDHGLTAADIKVEGARLHRKDVLRYLEEQQEEKPAEESEVQQEPLEEDSTARPGPRPEPAEGELEEIVPMSLIRRRIAERLVQAQQQAALLTTFNEIDMSAVKQLRSLYRDQFQEKYGIKLGFMSFFVKAAIDALKGQPELNAEIRDEQIVYRNYYHIGVAISSPKGLVVPVLRFAERLSFAEIEQAIDDLARRAADNKLKPHELEGGTFTITNGGVFGSLLSTPIVNPPQSGVLGMHAIQDRPVAREGQVVIRPMMYIALTYDHRLIDGREAVTFLKRIKDTIEDPARMLLEV